MDLEDRNFKLIGFCIVGFFILYLIMAGIIADQDKRIEKLEYKIESQQKAVGLS